MNMKMTLLAAVSAVAVGLAVTGCDVETEKKGEMPKVDVKDSGQVPKYDVKKTQDGRAPDIDVTPGRLPDVKVTGPDINVTTRKSEVSIPDVDVHTKKVEVTVPDVDVNKEKSTITVPKIDIKTADEKKAEDATR